MLKHILKNNIKEYQELKNILNMEQEKYFIQKILFSIKRDPKYKN